MYSLKYLHRSYHGFNDASQSYCPSLNNHEPLLSLNRPIFYSLCLIFCITCTVLNLKRLKRSRSSPSECHCLMKRSHTQGIFWIHYDLWTSGIWFFCQSILKIFSTWFLLFERSWTLRIKIVRIMIEHVSHLDIEHSHDFLAILDNNRYGLC